MWPVAAVVVPVCFLCLTAAARPEVAPDGRLSRLRENARACNVTSRPIDPNTSEVTVGSETHVVYTYDPAKAEVAQLGDNTLSKLYVAINCVFAAWTVSELSAFLEPFTVRLQSNFVYHRNDVFENDYVESMEILNRIAKQTEHFVNILMNYFNVEPYDSTLETIFLKSLLSLSIKINFIKSFYANILINDDDVTDDIAGNIINDGDFTVDDNDNNDDYRDDDDIKGSDDFIVQIILEVINTIQKFMALSCQFPTSSHDTNKLNSNPTVNSNLNESDIAKFLGNINELDIELHKTCDVRDMLLLNIYYNIFDDTLHDIELKTDDGNVLIVQLIEKIDLFYDLDVVFWYQEVVLKAIMKFLFSEILEFLKHNDTFSENIRNKFNEIYEKLFLDFRNLPPNLIKCFSILNNNEQIHYDDFIKQINIYTDSLQEIVLRKSENINVLPTNSGPTLETFLDRIVTNIESFKCFIRLYEFLRSEYNKHYIPFLKKPQKIKIFLQTVRNNDNQLLIDQLIDRSKIQLKEKFLNKLGCKYVRGLFHFCYASFVYLNHLHSESADQSDDDTKEGDSYLTKVEESLTDLLYNYWHRPHFEMVYDIIPSIEMLRKKFFKEKKYHDLKRLVYVTMADFDAYGLKFCHPPEYNFLFRYNMNFDTFGQFVPITREITTYMLQLKNVGIQKLSNKLPSIEIIYDTYKKNRTAFELYENIIQFNWKLEKKSIGYIYNNITSSVLSTSYVYAFYDFLFKFFLAQLYYEVYHIANSGIIFYGNDDLCSKCTNLFEDVEKLRKQLPKMYLSTIECINEFAPYIKDMICVPSSSEPLRTKTILLQNKNANDEFSIIGVSVALNIQKPGTPNNSDDSNPKQLIEKFYEEIHKMFTSVKLIKEFYLQLKVMHRQ